MSFHLGKPILVMMALALISGVGVALRPDQRKADLTLWVFADSHFKSFKPMIPEFEERTKLTVNLNLLNGRALAVRLGSMFMSDPHSEEIPDLVEMEISLMGRFFRPPLEEVGFLPLEPYLRKSGWYDKIVETRYAPWSKEGVIFGVPHDIHPCVITYREDLFREAGIDLPQAKTWPEFHARCVEFEAFWQKKGYRYRHALELPEGETATLQVMLLQRGINLVDTYGKVHLADPRVAQALAMYATMVAGPKKIAGQTSGGNMGFTRDLNEGNLCALITPDWRLTYVRRYGTELAGKLRLMPMPVFDPTDTPTSTWGGTMIGISRACKNPDAAWKLIEYLYFSEEGFEQRRKETDILPPIKAMWDKPIYHEADPYFGGQKDEELLTNLAHRIPPRHMTPVTSLATLALNDVLVRAVAHLNTHGEAGLEEACQGWLNESAEKLKARMTQWSFDK